MKLNNIKFFFKNYTFEVICFLAYIFAVITVSLHHEFWYDELQAFQISKDSVYNILFQVPHWEGHPPLWHLILKATSLLGLGVEGTLRLPNLIFIILAVFVLMFKSPFPKVVRLTLPFTFFLFYQYAVINRPYSLMVLELFLLAFLYKDKNKHPYWYTSVLALTCFTHVYGMFFATVISIVWGLEIKDKQKWIPFLKDFIKDNRFYCMLALLFLCILLVFELIPEANVYPLDSFIEAAFVQKFLYHLVLLPSDATVFNILNYNNTRNISAFSFNIYTILAIIWGLFVSINLFLIFKKLSAGKLFYFTYFGFLLFSLCIILWPHHIGLLFLSIIFCFWCALGNDTDTLRLNKITKFICAFIILVQLFWALYAVYGEFATKYNVAGDIAKYIQTNNLSRYKIAVHMPINILYVSDKLETVNYKQIKPEERDNFHTEYYINSNQQILAMNVNSYLGKNVFYTYNILHPDKTFVVNCAPSPEESKNSVMEMQKKGVPEILIYPKLVFENGIELGKYGNTEYVSPLRIIWDQNVNNSDFVCIKYFDEYKLWKLSFVYQIYGIYMKKDLYEKIKDTLKDGQIIEG